MKNSELSCWFDNRIAELQASSNPKDIRLMLELLKVRSQLKLDEKVLEKLDFENLSNADLLEELNRLQ